jgi:cell division control protein 11
MTASLPQRPSRKGTPLCLMAIGQSGCGKTTFLNTLTEMKECVQEQVPLNDQAQIKFLKSTAGKKINLQDFDFLSNKISLTFIETPGLGNQINNQQTFKDILLYIEQQYDNFLEQESRISRNVKQIMGFLIINQIHVSMLLFSLFPHKARLN